MDLSGLTEPITKLIEVVASGIGALGRPRAVRKESEAQAQKLITLATAMEKVQHLPLSIEYKDQNLQISLTDDLKPHISDSPAATLPDRTIARLAFQEQKRQENVESIVSEAAEALSDEEAVSPDPLDDDWVSRFFRIAEDISTEHMQLLWGRILAGEVKRPGSFSLRTLEVLRNIGQREADVFSRVAQLRISSNERDSFLVNPDSGKYLADTFSISFSDLLLLRELDLVVASDMLAMEVTTNPRTPTLLSFGAAGLIVESSEQVKLGSLPIIGFTSSGHQLAQLVPSQANEDYIRKVASLLKSDKVTFKTGVIAARLGNSIQLTSVQTLADV